MDLPRWLIALVGGLIGLTGLGSYFAFGSPTQDKPLTVRLENPALTRTYRSGTSSFGK